MYITEFIGTFFLVLVVALTGNAAAIGVTLMVMVFAGGHISGAHYNPAVTLAVIDQRKSLFRDAIIYIVVQIMAAIVAALMAKWYIGDMGVATLDLSGKVLKAFIGELLERCSRLCCAKCGDFKGTTGNSFYGLAIGLRYLPWLQLLALFPVVLLILL
jgi:aquaporin Z